VAKLIYSAIASLDGYVADESGNFEWAAPGEDVHRFVNDLERDVGTYLYGRRMYEVMAAWETADALPEQTAATADFAKIWQAADKIVYSKTLAAPSTARTRIEREFDRAAVRRHEGPSRPSPTGAGTAGGKPIRQRRRLPPLPLRRVSTTPVPTLTAVVAQTSQPAVALRPRAFVGVAGPDAEDYLQRMVSNDVEALGVGEVCDALLLTPKARVIATLRVWRRARDDFLLLTEPELGEAVVAELRKMRFAAKCEIEPEQHTSTIVFGGDAGIPTDEYGLPAREVLDAELEPTLADAELERLRIEAGTPRYGHELDDRVLPAEAGLDRTHISFTKGCYPGQEPIARLHYRGHVNRRLRVLAVDSASPGDEIEYGGKQVGRITSAVPGVALAYVREEVPDDAEVSVGGATARLHLAPARP
jgi:folate-binding protein YgfZ